MKAIGIIVLLLVIGLGAVTFMVTKEPDRTLDAQGQTWVDAYHSWRVSVSRQVAAERATAFETPAKNARLLAPPAVADEGSPRSASRPRCCRT